jgi:ATP-dependent helicase YprA (DUF1998 family)
MKTVTFIKNHCNHKKGDTVDFIVDNHADSLIANGVAIDKQEVKAGKPKKTAKQ